METDGTKTRHTNMASSTVAAHRYECLVRMRNCLYGCKIKRSVKLSRVRSVIPSRFRISDGFKETRCRCKYLKCLSIFYTHWTLARDLRSINIDITETVIYRLLSIRMFRSSTFSSTSARCHRHHSLFHLHRPITLHAGTSDRSV